jgi:hypothetical protein
VYQFVYSSGSALSISMARAYFFKLASQLVRRISPMQPIRKAFQSKGSSGIEYLRQGQLFSSLFFGRLWWRSPLELR